MTTGPEDSKGPLEVTNAAAMRNAKARQEGRHERCLEPGWDRGLRDRGLDGRTFEGTEGKRTE